MEEQGEVGNFLNNNYIIYENNRNESKTLQYLAEIRLYLKDIINNLESSDTSKIQ